MEASLTWGTAKSMIKDPGGIIALPGRKSARFVEVWMPFLWENHWEQKKTPKNGAVFCGKIMKHLREIVNIAMLKITVAASNFV